MTRDQLIKEAVKQRMEEQSKRDQIKELEQKIETLSQEVVNLKKSLFWQETCVPKWEFELKRDIELAFENISTSPSDCNQTKEQI